MGILDRIKQGWNAFRNEEATQGQITNATSYSGSSSFKPDRPRRYYQNERTIVTSIYARLGIDVASVALRHAQMDERGRYKLDMDSRLNDALTLEPNLDQGPRAWRQDIALTLFDKGVAALVAVDTVGDPEKVENPDILTLRVGEIVTWYPQHIRVSLYNEEKGCREEITLPKRHVSIVENPLYTVMNEPNSTLQRLIRKLSLLDFVDEQTGSGKLDIIIQLPYVIKSEQRKQQAEQRREDIEFQLRGSKYGIAYTDGTEKITQLNRPAENNLMAQIEYLIKTLYDQLGLTAEIMNGTADEATMINYLNRTIEPIIDAVVEAMQRSFIGHTRTKKGERILYFRNLFKLVPLSQIAEIADKFTRNEILTGNEIRGLIGIPPSDDPKADQLTNSNMPQPGIDAAPAGPSVDDMDQIMNESFDTLNAEIDKIAGGANGRV